MEVSSNLQASKELENAWAESGLMRQSAGTWAYAGSQRQQALCDGSKAVVSRRKRPPLRDMQASSQAKPKRHNADIRPEDPGQTLPRVLCKTKLQTVLQNTLQSGRLYSTNKSLVLGTHQHKILIKRGKHKGDLFKALKER